MFLISWGTKYAAERPNIYLSTKPILCLKAIKKENEKRVKLQNYTFGKKIGLIANTSRQNEIRSSKTSFLFFASFTLCG